MRFCSQTAWLRAVLLFSSIGVCLKTIIIPNVCVAQHFQNAAQGQWTNASGATLRLRASAGELRNTNANLSVVQNFGTIELLGETNRFTGDVPLGAQVTSRIGGLVRYTVASVSATQPAQTLIRQQSLHARWYSNLDLDGTSTKFIPNAVYVGGDAASAGRFTARGGMRVYEGTFYYDNSAAQTLLGDEAYQNIEIQRGLQAKRIERGANVTTRGEFRQNPSNEAGLQIHGALNIGTNADFPPTPLRRGSIEIGTFANASVLGALNVGGGQTRFGVREVRVVAGNLSTRFNTAEILVQTGATLCLADVSFLQANTFGRLSLTTASQTLRISGALRNDRAECDNTEFHQQSTVIFNASDNAASRALQTFPQEIMRTLPALPYGNLQTEGSDKTIAAAPRLQEAFISVAGDMRMNAGTLDVARGSTNPDSSGQLFLLNPDARVEYSALAEVRGAVKRILTRFPNNPAQNPATTNFVFNNAATRLLFTTRTLPDTMTLTVLQGSPTQRFQATTDVRRRIVVSYSEHTNRVWSGDLQLGYRATEISSPFQAVNERYLSFFAVSQNASQADTVRRIATTQLLRNAASTLGFGRIEQFALTNAGTSLFRVESGDNIILRGTQETVRSVRDGRWSNPLTWNVLRQPSETDSVEIAHSVHCGFRRNALDGSLSLGQVRELSASTGAPLAASISVLSSPNAAFLLGSLRKRTTNPLETFDDEEPPVGRAWQAGTMRTLSLSTDVDFVRRSEQPVREQELILLREQVAHSYQGIVLFTPPEGADSTILRLQHYLNAGTTLNGITLETLQTLASTGRVHNVGTILHRGAATQLQQPDIGGWVRFAGDSAQTAMLSPQVQNVPSLSYSRLAFLGQTDKRNVGTFPIVVRDSLLTDAQATVSLPANGEMVLLGGMLHNGRISSPRASSLVRLAGTAARQHIQGFGTMDGLTMENPRGAEVLRSEEVGRGLVVRSRLDLVRGALFIQDRANLLLEDDALISRYAESSLTAEPLRTGRIRLRTLGSRAMTATGELPTDSLALRTMEILNAGGYTLTKTAYILDSLRIATKLIAETSLAASPTNAFLVVLKSPNTRINPVFLTDSAEIIGAVRRGISPDTTTRLFNNRYASLKLLNPDALSQNPGEEVTATMRIIPQSRPEPNGDTTKIRRTITLDLAHNDNAPIPASLLVRVGYAWNVAQRTDETNGLDVPRVALQGYRSGGAGTPASWQTLGVPFRPTIRSAWNRLSESGTWQFGAMDSIRAGSIDAGGISSRFLALGIDSMLSVLPSAFLSAKVLLEGAYEPAYLLGSMFTGGQMRTLLASNALLPRSFDSTGTAGLGSLINARLATLPESTMRTLVDWLLVEVRPFKYDDSTLWIPALLRRDGQVISADAQTPLRIELPSDNEEFQIYLHHRNHASLAFAEAVKLLPTSRISLDFTKEANLASSVKSARVVDTAPDGTRVFAMRSGDASGNDGAINRFDYDFSLEAAWNRIFEQGYLRADADLNGIITTKDLNRIWNNRNSAGATKKP